jgi:hypothetical protein
MALTDLEVIRSILKNTVDIFGEVRANNGPTPNQESAASSELKGQHEFASGWKKKPVEASYSAAELRLGAAAGHVVALIRLLQDDLLPHGFATIARTILECSVRALWLLHAEADLRTRVIRGMVDEMKALIELAKMPGKDQENQTAIERVSAGARELGFEVKQDKRGNPFIEGVSVPGYLDLVRHYGDGKSAEIAYRYLSAVAHGELHGVLAGAKFSEHPTDPNRLLLGPEFDMEALVLFVPTILLNFMNAVDRYLSLYGWDATDWNAWKATAHKEMARLLSTQPVERGPKRLSEPER